MLEAKTSWVSAAFALNLQGAEVIVFQAGIDTDLLLGDYWDQSRGCVP